MDKEKLYILKGKCILSVSAFFLATSALFTAGNILKNNNSLEITTINITEMAKAPVIKKTGTINEKRKLIEVDDMEINRSIQNDNMITKIASLENNVIWRLPTEMGRISSYPNYYHVAYDITSPRGSSEVIYPVAKGIISGIYTDSAGAKIVTVRHLINGTYYSSQYVHLSNYANIYVGQEVDHNTPLGWMGTTGRSTGVHLHIALIDCNMFGTTDSCSDLNGFFRQAKIRYNQGFFGLGSVIYVPSSWNNR